MADLVDLNEDGSEGTFENVNAPSEDTHQESQAAQPQSTALPDKYRGKSIEEIVSMHQEAEKLIGRQAQEVGEVRRLADELIKRQIDTPAVKEKKAEPVEDVDFFVDPKAAVTRMVSEHPAVVEAQRTLASNKQERAKQELVAKHPDSDSVVAEKEFQDWVLQSKVRQRMFVDAHQNFDLESADELLTNYKQYKGTKTAVVEDGARQLKEESNRALKAATVPTSQSTGETGKKFYRRADLIRLQIEDPDRYIALQPEIMQAYAEKRVR
jgi:hypothetical protein